MRLTLGGGMGGDGERTELSTYDKEDEDDDDGLGSESEICSKRRSRRSRRSNIFKLREINWSTADFRVPNACTTVKLSTTGPEGGAAGVGASGAADASSIPGNYLRLGNEKNKYE